MASTREEERSKQFNPESESMSFDRRAFVGTLALGGAALAACASPPATTKLGDKLQPGPQTAPEGPALKAGLVGCGGRGTGAARNFLDSGPNLELHAMADLFPDRLETSRRNLKEKAGVEVPDERCFLGFDAYQKLIDSGVDIVILATPPHFRPEHVEAAVSARKQVFMEKPIAVDPVGVKSVLATGEKADALGVRIATGTQFRHQRSFIENYNRVMDGAIGEIVAARCYSLRSQLWYKTRQDGWSEMEAMLRDWVNWQWLSGDFIVEQHIHGIDVIAWFTGSEAVKANAMGGRARRVTGDQYDYFNVDYEMESGVHVHSLSRQIDGCTNNISRWIIGTKGISNCQDTIFDLAGNVVWKYEQQEGREDQSPYVQEHTDLITAIRTDQPLNEAADTANSTMMAILGREAAYSGLEVTREELMNSNQRLGPTEYAMEGAGIEPIVPVPGSGGGEAAG